MIKIWMFGSHDETWGIFTAENLTSIYACIEKEALEFERVLQPHMDEILETFTGTILEYELDTTEPLRYCNVTYTYATGGIELSKWHEW